MLANGFQHFKVPLGGEGDAAPVLPAWQIPGLQSNKGMRIKLRPSLSPLWRGYSTEVRIARPMYKVNCNYCDMCSFGENHFGGSFSLHFGNGLT